MIVHKFPVDDAARLRRLLGLIEAAEPLQVSPEEQLAAMERAGFVIVDRPPLDRFLGRRILVWIEEREARRLQRRAHRAASPGPTPMTEPTSSCCRA